MMTEFNKDVDKLSNDLTVQSRNSVMYIVSKNLSSCFYCVLSYRTTREANRRRTLVDTIKQSKEEIETTMRESFNAYS
jgi:hypothetical protein